MRYINRRFTYLLTYLLTYQILLGEWPAQRSISRPTGSRTNWRPVDGQSDALPLRYYRVSSCRLAATGRMTGADHRKQLTDIVLLVT